MPRSAVGDLMKSKTYDVFYQNVIRNIKSRYRDLGLTQEDIARYMFTSQPVISIKMRGEKSRFSLEDLFKLSLLFKCSVEDLIIKKE